MKDWRDCKEILVVRADNMGDLLMSSPAISNIKHALGSKITLLTSSKAALVVPLLPQIDDVIICELPWVKPEKGQDLINFHRLVELLKRRCFDGCIIFTVYSQNPMPAILLAYFANIPLRLAYCRENPYQLLSHWLPDQEPYEFIRHQVERDLTLVASIGIEIPEQSIRLHLHKDLFREVQQRLKTERLQLQKRKYYILHPGVSERKRQFPKARWIELAKEMLSQNMGPILITGSDAESALTEEIAIEVGEGCYSMAGKLSIGGFSALIADAGALISVNTGAVHLAAAVQTPVLVLHAKTNPQHTPWNVIHSVLAFSISPELKSKNEIIKWVDKQYYSDEEPLPMVGDIIAAIHAIT